MRSLKTTGIKELKNKLSAYLREVRSGSVILVSDHGQIIAEIKSPSAEIAREKRATVLDELAREGLVTLPSTGKKPLAHRPPPRHVAGDPGRRSRLMTPLYVVTSAILRYLFGDDGADTVRKTIDSSVQVLSSRLTVLEVHRAVVRAEKQAEVSAADAERVRGTFTRIARSWIICELSADILDRAAKEFPIEPVRSLDAIHLATSLWLLRVFPDLHVLSFDSRVASNAEALGIPLAG